MENSCWNKLDQPQLEITLYMWILEFPCFPCDFLRDGGCCGKWHSESCVCRVIDNIAIYTHALFTRKTVIYTGLGPLTLVLDPLDHCKLICPILNMLVCYSSCISGCIFQGYANSARSLSGSKNAMSWVKQLRGLVLEMLVKIVYDHITWSFLSSFSVGI